MNKQTEQQPITKNQDKILIILSKSEYALTSNDIAEELGISYQTAIRSLSDLANRKLVKKWPGPGHSFKFSFLKWDDTTRPPTNSVQPLSHERFIAYVNRMTDPTYIPRIKQESNIVPDTIKSLADISNKAAQGSRVSVLELDELKRNLIEYQQVVIMWYHLISSLLATENLWELETLIHYR